MKIEVQKLAEGINPFELTIAEETLNTWVKEVDDLYFAREGGALADLSLLRADDVVHVTGTIRATIGFACARTLEEHPMELAIHLSWSLLPVGALRGTAPDDDDAVELEEDDLDVSFYGEDGVDLEELVREAVLLELDPAPRSSVDVEIPSEYTTAAPPEGSSGSIDPRWAALASVQLKDD